MKEGMKNSVTKNAQASILIKRKKILDNLCSAYNAENNLNRYPITNLSTVSSVTIFARVSINTVNTLKNGKKVKSMVVVQAATLLRVLKDTL